MMSTRKILFYLLLLFVNIGNHGQEFGRGILLDDESFTNIVEAAPLTRGDFLSIPEQFSLKKFTPTPGNQGSYATCAGWSCGYSARTILYSIKNGLIAPLIDDNAFSPSFIYNHIRMDSTCSKGVDLLAALDILRDKGIPKLTDFSYECERHITEEDNLLARDYKVLEYRAIFTRFTDEKILPTKKSLSQFKPVVLAMDCPDSFMKCDGLWEPLQTDYQPWSQGHAIVVIGYDDNKYGGAFEIINSWGTDWGDGGFAWIKYSDFNYFCLYGFEIIDDIIPGDVEYNFSGSLTFRKTNGDYIKPEFDGTNFTMIESLPSGTKFELRISNDQPAYVYCLSSDLTHKVSKLFPIHKNMSPLLPYRGNNIAIPDEKSLMMLDNTKGKTYFCFIYSDRSLDIDELISSVSKVRGDFSAKIRNVLSDELVDSKNLFINTGDKIEFQAKGEDKSIVLIIVSIDHI